MVGAATKPSAAPPPQPPVGKPRSGSAQREPGTARRDGTLAFSLRLLASVLIVWHLTAVFLAPMSMPPSSPLVEYLAQGTFMQWYLDALYINHGYAFFAPDPSEGRLIYFDVYDGQQNLIKQGKFPDWDVQWPRLWYHRHFMLADQVGLGLAPESGQRRYLEAYARQLLRQFEGESVRVRWIAHEPLDPTRVDPARAAEQLKLTAPESYRVLMEVVQRRSDLGPEEPAAAAALPTSTPDVANRWIGVRR